MELLKLNIIEQNALIRLSPSLRKSAVDRLRQYYALLFHPDITGSYDSPLASINANLDDLEKGVYKTSPDNKTDISLVNKLKEQIKQYEAQIKQLKSELWKKQDYINKAWLESNLSKKDGEKIILSTLKCLRCGHEWIPRRHAEPKVCPWCKSFSWNKPKWK